MPRDHLPEQIALSSAGLTKLLPFCLLSAVGHAALFGLPFSGTDREAVPIPVGDLVVEIGEGGGGAATSSSMPLAPADPDKKAPSAETLPEMPRKKAEIPKKKIVKKDVPSTASPSAPAEAQIASALSGVAGGTGVGNSVSGVGPGNGGGGGGGSGAKPNYRVNPPPRYPDAARRAGKEGIVRLLVWVTAEGKVEHLHIEESSGEESFDKAAYAAVEKWEFLPALKDGNAVPSVVSVPVRFQLKRK